MTDSANLPKPRSSTCTCLRIRKAARRISQIYDHHLEPTGLTITQFGLLGHLRSFDGITIGALADRLVMDPTTLTRNLRPLVRDGLVAVEEDVRDRRARRLSLTADGLAAQEAARPAWADAQRHVERALGGADATALNAALDHLLDRLAE